uniref:RRM domain-containing protein n=2 Tax=Chrysotila carterae TaxID=13221 RepID=A0A7S4FCA6_CHRCT
MAGLFKQQEANAIGLDSYANKGATRTRANSTLFVRGFPKAVPLSALETIFVDCPGYIGIRQVRGSCFVDFETVKTATNAMIKMQGSRIQGYQMREGLQIDYDKDVGKAVTKKRERDADIQKTHHSNRSADYFCSGCGSKAIRTNGVLLCELPTRSTDGAVVLEEEVHVSELLLTAATEPVAIRREKGVEKQLRMTCRSCEQWLAYRPAKVGSTAYLYVRSAVLSLSPPMFGPRGDASAATSG